MTEFTIAAKFLAVTAGVALVLWGVGSLPSLVYKTAELAAEAQQNSMSYGKFSRSLWSQDKKPAPKKLSQ